MLANFGSEVSVVVLGGWGSRRRMTCCNLVEAGAAQFVDTFGGSNPWQSSKSSPSSSFPKLICDSVWRRSVISSIDTLSSLGGE
jgi:hypothetical protein